MNKDLIIYIDDSVDDQNFIKQILTKDYRVSSLLTFNKSTSEFIGQIDPELIILDLNFPSGSGIQFCQMIRAQERLKETPIIIFSSEKNEQIVKEVFDSGATDFVRKPILNVTSFKKKIQNHIKSKNLQSKLEKCRIWLSHLERFHPTSNWMAKGDQISLENSIGPSNLQSIIIDFIKQNISELKSSGKASIINDYKFESLKILMYTFGLSPLD